MTVAGVARGKMKDDDSWKKKEEGKKKNRYQVSITRSDFYYIFVLRNFYSVHYVDKLTPVTSAIKLKSKSSFTLVTSKFRNSVTFWWEWTGIDDGHPRVSWTGRASCVGRMGWDCM